MRALLGTVASRTASLLAVLLVIGWIAYVTLSSCVEAKGDPVRKAQWLDACGVHLSTVYSDKAPEFCEFVADEAGSEDGRDRLCAFLDSAYVRVIENASAEGDMPYDQAELFQYAWLRTNT